MKKNCIDALSLATQRGFVTLADGVVMLNAQVVPDLTSLQISSLICEQGFRPVFNNLLSAGHNVEPVVELSKAAAAIVIAGRNRKVNERNIARAWNMCNVGNEIVVVGDKTSGINALRKWVSEKSEISDSFSKYHSVVFKFVRAGDAWPLPVLEKEIVGYQLADGMFSASGPDLASELLVENFANKLYGRVADFGAGWGYLSHNAMKTCSGISELDLFEADYGSLQKAKLNLQQAAEIKINFHWLDVVSEFEKRPYDWVIMNPPFHQSRAADPDLGRKFIEISASTLPTGKRLMLVANRNLPYEVTIQKCFRHFQTLEERDGFKVIEAIK
ncbi:MAG: methyltransferase [Pseudomonadota bacterium]